MQSVHLATPDCAAYRVLHPGCLTVLRPFSAPASGRCRGVSLDVVWNCSPACWWWRWAIAWLRTSQCVRSAAARKAANRIARPAESTLTSFCLRTVGSFRLFTSLICTHWLLIRGCFRTLATSSEIFTLLYEVPMSITECEGVTGCRLNYFLSTSNIVRLVISCFLYLFIPPDFFFFVCLYYQHWAT